MGAQAPVRIAADLRFSVELPGREPVRGTLTGSGSRLEVRLSEPTRFAGGRNAGQLRSYAAALAGRGLTVVVIADDVVLLEVGATRAPWWQRPLTRSPHLRIAGARGAWAGATGRMRRSAAAVPLPGAELLPPVTPFPIAPTFAHAPRPVTTTHDPRRGGNPRLVLTMASGRLPADRRLQFPLRGDVTTIGSDPACDIRLEDLAPVHAVVVHDHRDELVLLDRAGLGSTLLNGEPVAGEGRVLRTGARVTLGSWSLAYRRAEYADHGRPFGGRIGGELGHQRPQPRTARTTAEKRDA